MLLRTVNFVTIDVDYSGRNANTDTNFGTDLCAPRNSVCDCVHCVAHISRFSAQGSIRETPITTETLLWFRQLFTNYVLSLCRQ